MTKPDTHNNEGRELALYITDCASVTDDSLLALYKTWLSKAETCRLAGFRREQDRKRFLVSRALIRDVLAAETKSLPHELVFESSPQGKPSLLSSATENSRLDFSLSHTGSLCVLAVNRLGRTGIDVECLDRDVEALAIARRYFNPEETQQLDALDSKLQQDMFIEFWTLKEAFSKKSGLGLAGYSLDSTVCCIRDGGVQLCQDTVTTGNPQEHFHRLRYSSRFHIALAYDADRELPVTCFRVIPGQSSRQLEPVVTENRLRMLT